MQEKRVIFPGVLVPLALLVPQLAITFAFFVWPSVLSLQGSLFEQDAFGLSQRFVGFGNFARILSDPGYLSSVGVTLVFAFATTALAMSVALALAVVADRAVRGSALYKAFIVWPHFLNGNQALLLVIIASAWKQVSYNFLFFLAGLQTIPRSLLEAAEIDGAGAIAQFRYIERKIHS